MKYENERIREKESKDGELERKNEGEESDEKEMICRGWGRVMSVIFIQVRGNLAM